MAVAQSSLIGAAELSESKNHKPPPDGKGWVYRLIESLDPAIVQGIRSQPLAVRKRARQLARQLLDQKYPPKKPKPYGT